MNEITVFLCFLVLCLSSAHLVNVRIVRETNPMSANHNYNVKAKSKAYDFSGPSHLLYLVGKCFTYSSDKYEYRVCPFDNITQHEKVWHSASYSGVIGVWKEWTVKNNSFDSLVFSDGDDCENGLQRSAKLVWICGQNVNEFTEKVIDIKEPKKCFYEILFASDFGCEDKYIYPHLSQDFKSKWDRIETNYFYEELTQLGYDSALKQLFIESAIIMNTTHSGNQEINFESKEKCSEEFSLLKEQNIKLQQRIDFLEKQLSNKEIKN